MIMYVCMISCTSKYMIICNTAALVPRAAVCSCIALSCAAVKKCSYRPVPSWKPKCTVPCRPKSKSTVPSRRGRNYIPSRPVVKMYAPSRPVEQKNVYRPVPSWYFFFTVQSRRYNCYIPSRPVVTLFFTVPSRREIDTHRPVPSHPRNYNLHYFTVPSRPVFNFFPVKHVKTVPSRPVSNITSHEKPTNGASACGFVSVRVGACAS